MTKSVTGLNVGHEQLETMMVDYYHYKIHDDVTARIARTKEEALYRAALSETLMVTGCNGRDEILLAYRKHSPMEVEDAFLREQSVRLTLTLMILQEIKDEPKGFDIASLYVNNFSEFFRLYPAMFKSSLLKRLSRLIASVEVQVNHENLSEVVRLMKTAHRLVDSSLKASRAE